MQIEDVRLLSSPAPSTPPSLELAATLYLPTTPDPVTKVPGLIVGHGAGSCRTRHADFCRECCSTGFAVLALDFRGHGESSGAADGPLEMDLCAAAAFLRAHPRVNGDRICYRGSSMGGFYGLKAAPEARFAAMALICPATESVLLHALDELEAREQTAANPEDATGAGGTESAGKGLPSTDGRNPHWDIPGLRSYFTLQQSLALARLVECPVLLIHARDDEIVPFTHTLLLTQSLMVDTTLFALARGTHTTAQHDPYIHRYTAEWLRHRSI